MTIWQIILPWILPMALLLVVSGLMSGSEAALFSLRRRDLQRLGKAGPGGRLAVSLLQDSEDLLSAILFWNLLINLAYFALVGIVGTQLERRDGGGAQAAVVFTAISLLTVIFFSEMLPKSLAVLAPSRFAAYCAVPLAGAVRLVRPALPLVRAANTLVRRLVWPGFSPEPEISLDAIRRAIDLGSGDAALAQREQQTLKCIVQLAETRVDQWMRPRSSLPLFQPPITQQVLAQALQQIDQGDHGQLPLPTHLLVLEPGGDQIVGVLNLDQLRPSQVSKPGELIEPVCYVPWSSSVSMALERLQQLRLEVAVVVNEFGDTIGSLASDDILARLLSGAVSEPGGPTEAP